MLRLPSSLQKVINEFSKLPGIGPKTAQRLAFYLLKKDNIDIQSLSSSIAELKQGVNFCSICHNMSESDPCNVCGDLERDHSLICVVEEPLDAQAIEKGGQYSGVFHILGGVLNPLEGIGPEKLNIDSLVGRVRELENQRNRDLERQILREIDIQKVSGEEHVGAATGRHGQVEIIIATNPSLEGETTAMHLAKVLKQEVPEAKVTRIARGLPSGGDLEYADDITLKRAMEGRREY